jgi:phosphoglucomutase
MGLLAAEMTAVSGRPPDELYAELTRTLGQPVYQRVDAPATPAQKSALARLTAADIKATTLAGETITSILTHAPGNGAALGGVKVMTANGWFAARPSGTEDIYKIYAESFTSQAHLAQIVAEAQQIVTAALD